MKSPTQHAQQKSMDAALVDCIVFRRPYSLIRPNLNSTHNANRLPQPCECKSLPRMKGWPCARCGEVA